MGNETARNVGAGQGRGGQETFEVDLDHEKVLIDGKWMSRNELAGLLTKRLAALDYNIGKLSSAIEFLDRTIRAVESFSVRLTPDLAAQLREVAARSGLHTSALIREAIVSYLVGTALSKLAGAPPVRRDLSPS